MSNTQNFYIGQTFEFIYPPDAAIWCNDNNAIIVQLLNGSYEIQSIPMPTHAESIAQRIAEIDAELKEIDNNSIRSIRALLSGSTQMVTLLADGVIQKTDEQELFEREERAIALRGERASLLGA